MKILITDFINEGPLKKIWSVLNREVTQVVSNRLLEYQVEEYNRNFYTKTILHRIEPVKLLDFYQPMYVRPMGKKHSHKQISTHSAKDLFEKSKFITLLGTAGSGKSTIIKYLLINALETKYKIPIKIDLRYLNSYDGDLYKYIYDEIFKQNQLAFDIDIIYRLLHSGEFLFCLDGYDELSSSVKDTITKNILDFTKLYNQNCYIITSRPYTNIELLTKFHNYEVCELKREEIEQFVRKQIPAKEKEIAEKIIESIIKNDNAYHSFLSNPLLLSMFILTFQTYSNIPPKKSAFYKQVFDSLFYLHDSMSKLAYEREKKSGLNKEQFESILKMFSFVSFFKQVFSFPESFLIETLNQIKERKRDLIFENYKLIEDLQVAICILQKEGIDYVFPHRSLQEYFASLYIVGLPPKSKEKIYGKILTEFNENAFLQLMTKDNFFSLLLEQDRVGVMQNLSIPFFEKIQIDFKSELSKQDLGQSLYKLYFFVNSFHDNDNCDLFIELKDVLDVYNQNRANIIRDALERCEKNKIELTNEEELKIATYFESTSKKVKPLLFKIIKLLKNRIKIESESDLNIIDLI